MESYLRAFIFWILFTIRNRYVIMFVVFNSENIENELYEYKVCPDLLMSTVPMYMKV